MTRDEKRTIECIADQVAGLLQVGGTTVEYPLTAVEVAALRAALAPPPTCGTCKHNGQCGIQAVFVSNKTLRRVTGCVGAYEPTEETR